MLGTAALLQGSWTARLLKAALARSWWQGKWAAKLEPYVRELAAMLSRPDLMARSLGWSLVYQILLVVLVMLYGLAIGQSLGFTSLLVVVPLVGLVTVVPVSLAGLGVREGAFVAFLGWLGLPMEQSFGIAVLSRLVNGVIIPLLGAAVFVFS